MPRLIISICRPKGGQIEQSKHTYYTSPSTETPARAPDTLLTYAQEVRSLGTALINTPNTFLLIPSHNNILIFSLGIIHIGTYILANTRICLSIIVNYCDL